jgi:Family of unknown function (DUF6074)
MSNRNEPEAYMGLAQLRGHEMPLSVWTEPPKVVPFPLIRRRKLIRNAAHSMAVRGDELGSRDPVATGEKMLAATLKRQREQLEKRGIDADTIRGEIEALERAIRCERARLIASGVCA